MDPAKKDEPHTTPPDAPGSVGWTEAQTTCLVPADSSLTLELGGSISPVNVEYETYGALSPHKDNVVFITHALSGTRMSRAGTVVQSRAGRTWRQKKPGWWDAIVGPGKAIDTNQLFVICPNVLGGCYGTTGPSSVDRSTGKPYGLRFPMVTVGDWVNLHMRLLDVLGIERVQAVVGGSLGGQQALEMALADPDRVERAWSWRPARACRCKVWPSTPWAATAFSTIPILQA